MRVVVVYESIWTNTATIAETIARGLEGLGDVELVSVLDADPNIANGADLLVVGGPTHVHGMSRASTRKSAVETETVPGASTGPGVREWLQDMPAGEGTFAAAFDTRIDKPRWLVGSASGGISRSLRGRGYRLIVPAESFVVTDGEGPLKAGEIDRADAWAGEIAQRMEELVTIPAAALPI